MSTCMCIIGSSRVASSSALLIIVGWCLGNIAANLPDLVPGNNWNIPRHKQLHPQIPFIATPVPVVDKVQLEKGVVCHFQMDHVFLTELVVRTAFLGKDQNGVMLIMYVVAQVVE